MVWDGGMRKPGSTVRIPINTFDSNDPAASVTATTWLNTDCHVHKDGSTTQRASSSGETLSINYDSVTGNHYLEIDTSDNTTAGFYAAGSHYAVRIEGVTVDAGNINAWVGTFDLGYEDAILNTTIATLASQTSFTLTAGSGDNDAYNGCPVLVHDVASAIQVCIGYVSDYVGSTKTVTLAADPGVFTMAATDNISIFMPSNVAAWKGTAVTTSSTTALPEVDTKSISDDATAANNAELMFDGTGYGGGTTKLSVNIASSDDIDLTATQKASVNTEVDNALDTAIPGTPTAGSINDVIKDLDAVLPGGTISTVTAANVATEIADAWSTDTLTEAYAADGAAATPAQLLYMIWSAIADFSISSTTLTCKKLDGTTTSMTFTLDDASDPTSRTRAT